jgi:putative copper resistance protein D
MYSLVVSVHILAAVVWVGGMLFLSLVLAPLVRSRKAAPEFMALFRSAALRFRVVAWAAIGVLLLTGPMLLSQRGIVLTAPSSWPHIVRLKLALVGVLLVHTILHDLVLGPRISQAVAVPESSRTAWEHVVVRTARWLPRVSLLLALAVVIAAAVLARS